ncbi:hypothetical protein LSH36_87g06003 [Paralvinella palmiformis]|uniref:Uncharacterized protein n=1 Tax=Paralvinella palmiformis TaxID=53620 RepID=A0AAD9K158_9ANNE|nr:hypothetical protein LSH36_87g06003 [Paralvinella palmiformis]
MCRLLFQAVKKSQETFYAQMIYPALDSSPILENIATIGVTVPVTPVRGLLVATMPYKLIKTDGRTSLKSLYCPRKPCHSGHGQRTQAASKNSKDYKDKLHVGDNILPDPSPLRMAGLGELNNSSGIACT